MINLNAKLLNPTEFNGLNRAFLYGDALFDTLKLHHGKLVFLEAHYFRLLASMRQLRMEIPPFFTESYWENEILKTLAAHHISAHARIRTSVWRDAEGLYTPKTNQTSILIQTNSLLHKTPENYSIGVFKDYYLNTSPLENLKTTNKLPNILAAIFAKENQLDNMFLLNHKKQVVGATNANVFIVKGSSVSTPPLSEGCLRGIIRQKVIDMLKQEENYDLMETPLSVFDLLQADAVFLTNSIFDIQNVTHFKNKIYRSEIGCKMVQLFQKTYPN